MIWIDLATAPNPWFFRPLIRRLGERGHDVWLTARDYGETIANAERCGLAFEVVGRHGGGSLILKGRAIWSRSVELAARAAKIRPILALGFNSYAQAIAAKRCRIPFVTITDYEYQPANHLAFRLAEKVIVPEAFDPSMLRRQGARSDRVVFFQGLKEDVTLADFVPDPEFPRQLREIGVPPERILVTMRPPATNSSYHRFGNDFFYDVVRDLAAREGVSLVVLPRYPEQAHRIRGLELSNVVIPVRPLDGLNLVYCSDAVVSAGGSMNREAVALGTPTFTVFAGRMAGVDERLIGAKLMSRLLEPADLGRVHLRKKEPWPRAVDHGVIDQVLDAVLSSSALAPRATRGRDPDLC